MGPGGPKPSGMTRKDGFTVPHSSGTSGQAHPLLHIGVSPSMEYFTFKGKVRGVCSMMGNTCDAVNLKS